MSGAPITAAGIRVDNPGLRPGQREALRRWAEALRAGSRSELVVVPVGYGKTVIGVGSFAIALAQGIADTCLYLTPTDVLRTQVYHGVERALGVLGSRAELRKFLAENATLRRAAANRANFIVATYQQVAAAPDRYARLAAGRRVHMVCDEAHHLGERGQWAAALGSLPVASTMLLSATPVRLDREPLAGARYVPADDGEGLVIDPLVHVTMRQAWREGRILKRLAMQMKDYAVELRGVDGEVYTFTASEMADLPDFDQRCVRQQLRWNDDYVQPLVREFARTLEQKMRLAPGQHQGLVFAATTAHADHLARVFARHHPQLRCTVVHSGPELAQSEAEARLRDFHAGRYDVLIQVKKASEGFDAPTVSVLLKLDAVFSREPVIQQLGRGLRFNHNLAEAQNVLHVFIGRDPRLAPIIELLEREAAIPAGPATRGASLTCSRQSGLAPRIGRCPKSWTWRRPAMPSSTRPAAWWRGSSSRCLASQPHPLARSQPDQPTGRRTHQPRSRGSSTSRRSCRRRLTTASCGRAVRPASALGASAAARTISPS